MTRSPLIPVRWPNHGVDIRAYLADGNVLFAADDVLTALEISVDVDHDNRTDTFTPRYPTTVTYIPDVVDDDANPVAFITPDQVRLIAADNPSYLTHDFTDWIDEFTAQFDTATVEALISDITRPRDVILQNGGSNHSIADAARTLTREGLPFGQTGLFTALHEIGWIARSNGDWRAQPDPIKHGWLIEQPRPVQARKNLYPQVRITGHGLTAVRPLLQALLQDRDVTPTLVEL